MYTCIPDEVQTQLHRTKTTSNHFQLKKTGNNRKSIILMTSRRIIRWRDVLLVRITRSRFHASR